MTDSPREFPLPYVVNCSILFQEVPLLRRPAAAKAAGFDAVEFWWPFPESVPSTVDVDRFVTAIQDAGVQLAGLNLAAGDMPAGDRGLVSWPGREAEFRESLAVAVDIGSRLGVAVFNALYGNRISGPEGPSGADAGAQNAGAQDTAGAGDVAVREQDELATEHLLQACRAVRRIGATILVEPLSGAPAYPLRTTADVIAVLDRVRRAGDADNLAMLADLYHLAGNGDDVAGVIAAYAGRIGHVQIADWPGRHEPGTGSLAITEHLSALVRAGYRGRVALEYVPSTTTEQSFGWLPREHRRATGHSSATSRELR